MISSAGDTGKIAVGLMQFLIPLGGFHHALGFGLQVFDLIGNDLELGIDPDIDFTVGFGNLPGQIHQFKMGRQATDRVGGSAVTTLMVGAAVLNGAFLLLRLFTALRLFVRLRLFFQLVPVHSK